MTRGCSLLREIIKAPWTIVWSDCRHDTTRHDCSRLSFFLSFCLSVCHSFVPSRSLCCTSGNAVLPPLLLGFPCDISEHILWVYCRPPIIQSVACKTPLWHTHLHRNGTPIQAVCCCSGSVRCHYWRRNYHDSTESVAANSKEQTDQSKHLTLNFIDIISHIAIFKIF